MFGCLVIFSSAANHIAPCIPESGLVKKPIVNRQFLTLFFQLASLFELVVPSVLRGGSKWGYIPLLALKSIGGPSHGRNDILVEFSSPNIAKPFYQDRLMNLYEGASWDVVQLNCLSDWGKQYCLRALGLKMLGDTKSL